MKASKTFLLGILVVGLGAYIWFLERHQMSSAEKREQMRRAFDLPVDRITRIGIRTPDLDVTVQRGEDGWVLAHPENARASEAVVNQVLARLRTFERGELITPADMRSRGRTLADFGLEIPRLVLRLETPTQQREYRIGDPTPLENAIYIKEESSQNVMDVSSDLIDILPNSARAFRDRDLIPLQVPEVSDVSLVKGARALRLVRKDGVWHMTEPMDAPLDETRMSELLQKLDSATIEGVMNDPEEDVDYGFGRETAAIRLRSPTAEIPYELVIGGDIPGEPDLAYAKISGVGGLIHVSRGLRRLAYTDPAALRDRRVVNFAPEHIAAVDVEYPEALLRLERQEHHWRLTSPLAAGASSARVQRMLQYWIDARVEQFEGPDPDAEVVYEVCFYPAGEDREPVRIEILGGETSSGRARLRRKGGDEVLRVVPDLVRFSPADPLPYLSRRIFDFDPDRVIRLSVDAGEQTMNLRRPDAGEPWDPAPEPPEWPAQALSILSTLHAARLLEANPASLDPYGLDQPDVVLSIGLGGDAPANRSLLLSTKNEGPPLAMVQGGDVVFELSPVVWESFRAVLPLDMTPPDPETDEPPATP